VTELPCLVGSYCPWTPLQPLACPRGFYCPSANLTAPTPCPPGTLCAVTGLERPNGCPAGQFCRNATSVAENCTAGSYCPANSSAPTPCPNGTLCETSGLGGPRECPAGFFCNSSTAQEGCPVGFYCPTNSSTPRECYAGSYCPFRFLPEGINCTTGDYCPAGSKIKTLCPAGYECKTPDVRHPCPNSHYCIEGKPAERCNACNVAVLRNCTPTEDAICNNLIVSSTSQGCEGFSCYSAQVLSPILGLIGPIVLRLLFLMLRKKSWGRHLVGRMPLLCH
jgi:hypothetical protein